MISWPVQQVLVDLAKRSRPHETCGVLLRWGATGEYMAAVPGPNYSSRPTEEFYLDPELPELIRARCGSPGDEVALWHSHPTSSYHPSRPDFLLMERIKPMPMAIVGLKPFPIIVLYGWEPGHRRIVALAKFRLPVLKGDG